MIIINGKVFRNLEEQVAYLSEMIPLFEEDNGELVIKQGDGTEIARIVLNDIANISINTASDVATLTMTYNDGTTATQTIDMTSYLKKVSTTTSKNQAYIKQADGTQSLINLDDQASNNTIVIRTSSGRINAVDPVYDGNVATKKYVDDSVAGVSPSPRYKHIVGAVMEDGCSDLLYYILIFESSSNTAIDEAGFKALFNKVVNGHTDYKYVDKICSQYLLRSDYTPPAFIPSAMVYDFVNDKFMDTLAYNNASLYSSDLTLVSVNDSVSSL